MGGFETSTRVTVKAHFRRSINLRHDVASSETISSYIVTPEIEELATEITRSFREPRGARAWAITGPYGSGKSSFGLFLTDVLCTDSPVHLRSNRIREQVNWNGRLFPVIITGYRGSLIFALVSALAEAVEGWNRSFAEELRLAADSTTADRVCQLFERSISVVMNSGYNGLLLIIDELGKFLEYAVSEPNSEDLIALQYLAEEADRLPGQFLLITLLHSAFADYLPAGSRVLRAEWQKIQGRFRDAVFTTSLNQHLTLLSRAIDAQFSPELRIVYDNLVDEVLALGDLKRFTTNVAYRQLLRGCSPLHPIVSLLTWPIFRSKMAQNERTLFSFLSSYEYKGFSWFLERQDWNCAVPPVYRVADLYDYIAHALGSAVAFGDLSRGWLEIEDALNRVDATAPELTVEVVKTIGLLSMYGSIVGLDASPEVLQVAIGNREAVDSALDYLIRNKIAVYRRFSRSFRLWEGSDVDLDEAYERAKHHVPERGLAQRLMDLIDLRPVVARKHYIETGTLRTFEVRLIDGTADAIKSVVNGDVSYDSDGMIVYVLSTNEPERSQLIDLACELTKDSIGKRRLLIFGFPGPVVGLDEVVRQLETWRWLRSNDPRVQGDRAARHELKARIEHFRQRVGQLAGRLLGIRGYRHEPGASKWVRGGQVLTFESAKEFSQWLSALCDQEYHASPVIPNELINRRYLSSAAVAARRNLMEAMLERAYEPQLGFVGGAAEATMYHAILVKSGIHKTVGNVGYFDTPNEEWRPVWQAIEEFMRETVERPKPVTALYERLAEPPYGIRPGVVPVLLLAFMITRRHEVALYEGDVYVPGLRIEVMERLTRQPAEFSVRLFEVDSQKAALLDQIARIPVLTKDARDSRGGSERLLAVVEPLVRFMSGLKPYAKSTKRFSDARIVDMRLAVMRASDPYALIFEELPAVFGVDLKSSKGAQEYVNLMSNAIVELESAYPKLLAEIESEVCVAFGLETRGDRVLESLREQAERIRPWASEPRLKRFLIELSRKTSSDWREGIGRAIMDGVSPGQWTDSHVPQFRARLHLLAGDFIRLRELVDEQAGEHSNRVIRVSLLDGAFEEVRTVTRVPPEWEEHVAALVDELRNVLRSSSAELRRVALARALVSELGVVDRD